METKISCSAGPVSITANGDSAPIITETAEDGEGGIVSGGESETSDLTLN